VYQLCFTLVSEADRARVTLGDVARRAGASPAAASLALRGRPGVSDATRRRIAKAAADLGYHVRPIPVSTAERTIGVLVAARTDGRADPSYGGIVAAMNHLGASRRWDVRLGLLAIDDDDVPIGVPPLAGNADLDGYVVIAPWLPAEAVAAFGGRPIVLVDGDTDADDDMTTVIADDASGAADATRLLLVAGHRRIALVGTTRDGPGSVLERRRGYQDELRAVGLAPRFVDGPPNERLRLAATVVALALEAELTAVVCGSDVVALAVLAAARAAGVDVPRDLSVVGFDDIDAARLSDPPLTTVSVDRAAMGRLAFAVLEHRIARRADPPFTALQRARLIERATVAGVPGPSAGDRGQPAVSGRTGRTS
jgi:DNA-binding LacI/PurR family transcriptional regulator